MTFTEKLKEMIGISKFISRAGECRLLDGDEIVLADDVICVCGKVIGFVASPEWIGKRVYEIFVWKKKDNVLIPGTEIWRKLI